MDAEVPGPMDTQDETRVEAEDVAALAADLRLLVDQLEVDCASRKPVSPEAAAQIHNVRARAERLFIV